MTSFPTYSLLYLGLLPFALLHYVCVCVCVCAVCVCVYIAALYVCVGAGGAGIGKCVWVWGLRYMHRWCWCGSSASVLQKWCEIRTKLARNSFEIRANFVRISYEFRPSIRTVNVVVTNFVRNSYEVQTICMNLCQFCVCVGVPGRNGCCLSGHGCMVCACLGDMCMHWWFLGSWVVLLNHVGQYFCVVCSL